MINRGGKGHMVLEGAQGLAMNSFKAVSTLGAQCLRAN